jgi:hypothetical protein
MAIKSNFPDRLQIRLTSSVELIRASLEPYMAWIEEMMGVPLDQTLTLEVDADPGDAIAERLLPGLPLSAGTKSRNRSWHSLIEEWTLPDGGSPRIAASFQRERRPKTAPATVFATVSRELFTRPLHKLASLIGSLSPARMASRIFCPLRPVIWLST